jgi:hypothetical protein
MFDFSDINPDEIGDGTGIAVPTGAYKAKISSCTSSTASTGRAQFEFKVSIAEAPYAGAIRTEWISVPQSKEDKVKYIWTRAFQSIGIPPEKLKAAGVVPAEQIPQFFTGKACHIDFVAGNKDMGQYDKLKFITEAAYKVKKAAATAATAAAAAAPAASVASSAPVTARVAPAAPAAPTPPAAPVNNGAGGSSDLLAMLNG